MNADGIVRLGLIPGRVKRLALRQDGRLQLFAGQIRGLCARHGCNAGNVRDRLLHALVERDVRSGRVAILRQDDLREQQMIRAESGIDGGESCKRADKEAGADDQQCCQRDLKSDDGLRDARIGFDAVGNLRAHGRECWRQAEQQARRDRDQRGKTEYLPIEVRREPRDGAASDVGERQTRGATDRGEQQALDQHLPQDPCPPGSEREAHAHLALPPCSAREHQGRNVCAGENKDQTEKDHRHRDGGGEDLLLREQAAAAVAQRQPRQRLAGVDWERRSDDGGELDVKRRLCGAIADARLRARQDVQP